MRTRSSRAALRSQLPPLYRLNEGAGRFFEVRRLTGFNQGLGPPRDGVTALAACIDTGDAFCRVPRQALAPSEDEMPSARSCRRGKLMARRGQPESGECRLARDLAGFLVDVRVHDEEARRRAGRHRRKGVSPAPPPRGDGLGVAGRLVEAAICVGALVQPARKNRKPCLSEGERPLGRRVFLRLIRHGAHSPDETAEDSQ